MVISSFDGQLNEAEPRYSEYLFPEKMARAQKYKSNKPVIFLSARVHPGEAPASHSIDGVLNFLT